MILKPGDSIVRGKYQIVDLLGKGGFGEVYKAIDTQLEREVAIKVIQRAAAGSTDDEFMDYKARFIQEAKIGAQIRDDNVIAVYALEQHGQEDDLWLLVGEFAAGGSLATRIATKVLPVEQVVEIAIQICKGLDAIHRSPLNGVHRDIKPSNILFDQLGRTKVADLGLVQSYGMSGARSQGMGGAQPGTPGYMSPEQETETGYLTPASDIYSLGCVMFEALTQKVYQYLPRGTKANTINPDVPAGLAAILDKALAVEIANRYQDAASMRKELEEVSHLKIGKPRQQIAAFQFRIGDKAQTPEEWAELADKHWADGVSHLTQGSFEQWLQMLDRKDLSLQIADIRRKYTDADFALEQVLNLLLPKLEQPQLLVNKESLDFGQVERGESQAIRITITNPKRGLLYGVVKSQVPWIRIPNPTVKCLNGQTQTVEVKLDSSKLGEGETLAENAIEIHTYSGQTGLSGHVRVTWAAELSASPGRLNFGEHMLGEETQLQSQTLTVRNKGGGKLQGEVTTSADWLAIIPTTFELESGKETPVQLTADPSRLSGLGIFRTEVKIASNAGFQAILASITNTSPSYGQATRWQKWSIYLGGMIFIVAGWAVPLAFGISSLLGLRYTTPVWQIAGLAVWVILAWIMALIIPRPLAQPLDEIENFYHRGNLAKEIPGRQPAFFRRVVFGLLVGGAAIYFASQSGSTKISIHLLNYMSFSLSRSLLAGAAGFTFGFLLINSRKSGKDFTLGDRLMAGPYAVLLAIAVGFLRFSIGLSGNHNLWSLIWPIFLGLVLAGDNFVGLPLRLQWLFARFKPALPGLILMGLFFSLARASFLSSTGSNLLEFYALRTSMSADWHLLWWDLFFIIGVLLLGLLGLWLNNARNDDFRANFSATIAALLISGIPALFGYLVLNMVDELLDISSSLPSFFGSFGLIVVLGLAIIPLWVISGQRQFLKRTFDAVFIRLETLLSKIPGLARQSNTIPLRSVKPIGLSDYLTGNAAIPFTASLIAVIITGYSLPATYCVIATILKSAARVSMVVFLVVLCISLPVGLLVAGYWFLKVRRAKR